MNDRERLCKAWVDYMVWFGIKSLEEFQKWCDLMRGPEDDDDA